MSRTIPLGRIGGVPIRVGPSWLVVGPAVGAALFAGIDQGRGGTTARLLVAIAGTIALFASILVHEVAHALVARRRGVAVSRIVLFLMGGYTEMEVEAARPRDEVMVSLAGPVVSAFLGLGFWGLATAGPDAAGSTQVAGLLGVVNGAVAVFNLLPGFPLDGGRITRSVLVIGGMTPRMAESVAVWLGVAIGSLLVVVGAVGHLLGRSTSLIAIPVGGMVAILAWAARPVERRTAADVMRPAPEPVSEAMAVAALPDRSGPVPVMSSGRLVGLVTGRQRPGSVAEAMDPVLPGDVVAATAPLSEVVARLGRQRRTLVVTDATGAIVGMIGFADLPADLLSGTDRNLMK